ncbi:MAG: hypothetical protein F6K30_28270 [Cyanothece sp. SIO2G6]|nr:hypothetical protein [Cyanothece sp. SIO2G6]
MSLTIGILRGLSREFADKKINQTMSSEINSVLEAHGLARYTEDFELCDKNLTLPEVVCSYKDLHCLRYLSAKIIENDFCLEKISLKGKCKISPKLRNKIYRDKKSHLICHSDFDGYYIPVDFSEVIREPDTVGWLGSSFQLCRELTEIAKSLNFELGEYMPDLKKLSNERGEELKETTFRNQKWLLLCLYNIAKASIVHNSAIYFM